MGIPLYKPKQLYTEFVKHDASEEEEDPWSIFPPQHSYPVAYEHSRTQDNHHNNSFNTYTSASTTSQLRRRMTRRHSMLTSSLMDRRRSTRAHHSAVTSHPIRNRLDRRLQQRIHEKEDLLEQLELTVSLLDQFLSARTTLGDDMLPLPPFMIRDLPAVLETAASLAALTQSSLSSHSGSTNSTSNDNNPSHDTTTLHDMVEILLQVPPYSTRILSIENSIVSAHQRIREQLNLLGSSFNIPSPSLNNIGNRITTNSSDTIPMATSSGSPSPARTTAARTTIFPLLDNDSIIPPS
ncbi:hypothetical protein BDB01DRAFT_832462 [Pilobolus umbonatus]|nr:hypothetical protein BDB01DRAFT_832462 [Pilobolus umbonatus]